MSRQFERCFGWVVDRPLWTGLLVSALTAIAVVGYVDPHLVTDLLRAPAEETVEDEVSSTQGRETRAVPKVDPFTMGNADAVLVVQSSEFFTPQRAEALRAIVDRLEDLDYVSEVLWLDRVPILNLFGLREPLFPRPTASPRQFDLARERALSHPLVGGQLLSADGGTLLMLVRFDWLFVTDDEDVTSRLRREAQAAIASYDDVDFHFLVTGRTPMYVTYMQSQRENQKKYQIIGYSMVGLMALLLFRGLRAVMIVAAAPSLGVFWTLGILRYFELHDNPFNDVVLPILVSLVGLTDGVHLMVEIRRQMSAGLPPRMAARAGVGRIGLACALTSITTAIGFLSLGLAHHDVVREFGYSCVLGVTLTFLAVMLVIPSAAASPVACNLHQDLERGFIERHLARISGLVDFVVRRSRLFSALAVTTTLLLLGISLTLRPDERRSNSLPQDSEAARALAIMDKAFGGLELSSVIVRWEDTVPDDAPQILEVIGKVDERLHEEPLIGHPLSLKNLLYALPGDQSREQRMRMLELLPPPLKRAFYTPERQRAEVTFRVQDLGIAQYGEAFQRIEQRLREIEREHPGFSLELTGPAVRRWRDLYQIVVDLAASLGSATVVIFAVLMIAYRSVRMGLIAVIPNVFPLAVTGTYLVLTGQALEIVSVCAFTVCLGIAVDDTIHFLTRYREERPAAVDDPTAIRKAFTGTGTALIMTTLVLVTGFATVIFSDLREQRVFATMGALTISTALAGDLLFLPALLARFAPRRRADVTGPGSGDILQQGPESSSGEESEQVG